MKNYDLIIFDWDGTLINSIDWIVYCLQLAAEESQCEVPTKNAARDIIGLSLVNAIQNLFPGINLEKQQQLISRYSHHFLSRQITHNDLFEGVCQMLLDLKKAGYLLAVATGKTRLGLDRALRGTGMTDFFSITRCADETESKPDPAMLIEITDYLNIDNTRTLMIGDTVHDLQMAENADISSVAVSCGAHPQELLKQYNPLYCLQHTKQLTDFL